MPRLVSIRTNHLPDSGKNKPSEGHTSEPATHGPERAFRRGRARLRREDEPLITGRGSYVDDLQRPGALHLVFQRSPFACGDILECDTDAAMDMPGVTAIFTGADVAHLGNLSVNPILETVRLPGFPVLADARVMAVGQPVAAIVADTQNAALDAAEAVFCDIDARNAVMSPETSSETDLFADIPGNEAAAQSWADGDIDAAFTEAEVIVEAHIRHPRLAPSPMEPRAAAADFDRETDLLTVWLSTQTPHRGRKELARILDVPVERIRVVAPDVGGAFGMKASLYPEDVMVAWAALQLQRPIRWTATRGEDLLAATHGRGASSRGKLALSKDGLFLGLNANVTCPLGHWLPSSAVIPAWNAGRILPGPYAVPAIRIDVRGVLTTTAPVGIYRGAGRPEAAVLMERLVDKAAHATGLDPVEIRRINLLPPETLPLRRPTGTRLDSGNYPQALERLYEYSDYANLRARQEQRRTEGELIGIGLAFYVEPCGQGWESARVTLNPDGTILAATGTSSQGHGRETAFAQIVADVLGIDPDRVAITFGDTDTAPDGIGALASRSTAIGGSALLQAAREVRDECRGRNAIAEPVTATVKYEADGEAWGYGCYLAIVAIDRETGVLTVENMVCVDDAGILINPMLVEGQIMGGIAQGLGEALMEQIRYNEDGQLLTGSLMDYALPRADNMPDIAIEKLTTPAPVNLLGAKGVGEAGAIGAPAAILNAAVDALAPLGVTDLTMPLTSETIWRAINTAARKDDR